MRSELLFVALLLCISTATAGTLEITGTMNTNGSVTIDEIVLSDGFGTTEPHITAYETLVWDANGRTIARAGFAPAFTSIADTFDGGEADLTTHREASFSTSVSLPESARTIAIRDTDTDEVIYVSDLHELACDGTCEGCRARLEPLCADDAEISMWNDTSLDGWMIIAIVLIALLIIAIVLMIIFAPRHER